MSAAEAVLSEHDLGLIVEQSTTPLLLIHAEGDEQVPVEHSIRLHELAPGSRLVVVPGGHHRSVQHDPELQAFALRFLRQRLLGVQVR